MKGRDILKNMVSTAATDTKSATQAPAAHKPAGAVRAMNISLNRLGDEAAAAKELRVALAAGDKVIEINPEKIEGSFVRDRIPNDKDLRLDELVASIRENGQQVPILVRPHPKKQGEYQAAYGHRRLHAAAVLGRPVKAVVRQLADDELVIAQGQENGSRLDLSFIERALFAKRLDQHGIERDRIAQTLSVDKPEVSRLLQVADGVSTDIILAIGPAPKIGRPRWLGLADLLKDPAAQRRVVNMLGDDGFIKADTSERFSLALKAAEAKKPATRKNNLVVKSRDGLVLASMDHTVTGAKVAITSREFAKFLESRMSDLVTEFETRDSVKSGT